ncbi:hypothetical protein L1987_15988 [Smallanthus sonchifolius]|uniref:Uncharacterized protein n=1 Tax=Smallanthus sonchifolius TaxID=185202 RepID=A0ACB9J976_9ASTR|nr:hypothetical protein L1987_15988 [Smallanthus sonchifolius]
MKMGSSSRTRSFVTNTPEVNDCAVIPFPDKDVGQFPMAYVVRKNGSNLTEKGVMDFVSKQVAPYKRIRRVAFIGSVPKNPSGKIQENIKPRRVKPVYTYGLDQTGLTHLYNWVYPCRLVVC